MRAIKNLFLTINASFENMVSQLENHEAIAESALKDFERTAAKAQMHYKSLQRETTRLRSELTKLEGNQKLWKARAKEVYQEDQGKALECVARYTHAAKLAESVRKRINDSQALEHQVSQDIARIMEKLHEVRCRKVALACRQSRTHSVDLLDPAKTVGAPNSVLDRWEEKIVASEMRAGLGYDADPLDEEFVQAEQKEQLLTKLEEFIRE